MNEHIIHAGIDRIRIRARITDTISGSAVDPSEVYFKVTNPAGTVKDTQSYGGGTATKNATGDYYSDFATTASEYGWWTWEAWWTGTYVGGERGTVYVHS